MPSTRSKLINFMLRNRHFLHLRLKPDTIDEHTSIPQFRAEAERMSRAMAKLPEDIELQPTTIDGMTAEWIYPTNASPEKVILYTHGGGYISGSCTDHRAIVSKMVKSCGVKTLQFDYRLAPEHPFPAALDDSVKAYCWLLAEGYLPENIVIMGESAGGGLCLALLLAIRDQNLPLPAAGVALSAWTDLKCTGESYETKAKLCLSPMGSWTVFSSYYVGDNDPGNPGISPLYADLHGLPPLLIITGDDEVLRDDSIRFAEKAQQTGVDATLRVSEGMVHCYPLMAPMFPEATAAMSEISTFINTHLYKTNSK
ncbi:MAG: alpha/beta hydrolase [Chloroflexi bacterium]|nr:MAG: alpha/beta hydrolase [Chloroflexota bacterium]